MCTAFSRLLALSESKRDPEVVKKLYAKAMVHLEFVCRLYRKQVERGLYFLHEHPAAAKSWDETCVLEVLALVGVNRINGDQCQLGQETEDGRPIRKRTGFMSNSPEVLAALHKKCTGRHG